MFVSCAVGIVLLFGIGKSSSQAADRSTGRAMPGDLVFKASTSEQASALKEATGSPYGHCGIIIDLHGTLHVAEAVNHVQVSNAVALGDWVQHRNGGVVVVKRWHGGLTPDQLSALRTAMQAMQDWPYDVRFEPDHRMSYCSEFVYNSYANAGIGKLGEWQPFSSLHLDGRLVKELIRTRYTRQHPFDPSVKVITPVSVMNSGSLEQVTTLP